MLTEFTEDCKTSDLSRAQCTQHILSHIKSSKHRLWAWLCKDDLNIIQQNCFASNEASSGI